MHKALHNVIDGNRASLKRFNITSSTVISVPFARTAPRSVRHFLSDLLVQPFSFIERRIRIRAFLAITHGAIPRGRFSAKRLPQHRASQPMRSGVSRTSLRTGWDGWLGRRPARERRGGFPVSALLRAPSTVTATTQSPPIPSPGGPLVGLGQRDGKAFCRAVSFHLLFPPSATVLCSARRG
jgi:hypothetical protein